jgi:hypothetical protein
MTTAERIALAATAAIPVVVVVALVANSVDVLTMASVAFLRTFTMVVILFLFLLVWCGLVWFGLVWFGIAIIKIYSQQAKHNEEGSVRRRVR